MKGGDHRWTGKMALIESQLLLPFRWKKPRKIFVNSTSDLFHESLPDEDIDKVFDVMESGGSESGAGSEAWDWNGRDWSRRPWHIFQVLTKRSARARAYMLKRFARKQAYADKFANCPTPEMRDSPAARLARQQAAPSYWKNIWLGASVEDQERADERIPHLLTTPAAVRFLSCEPLLGPIDLDCPNIDWMQYPEGHGIVGDRLKFDWVIAGGESGPGARPMHPDWARSLRDQCINSGVPFFFKQIGEWAWCGPHMIDQEIDIANSGVILRENQRMIESGIRPGKTLVTRIGKKAAGRLLDGVEHSGFPEAVSCQA